MSRRPYVAAVLVALGVALGAPAAQAAPWVPNGEVNAFAQDGNTLYMGGLFDRIGPYTGASARIGASSGELSEDWPIVEGEVRDIVRDGAGGWYLAGDFTAVGGLERSNLAHVLPDRTVDPAFAPSTNGPVNALLFHGTSLFLGGKFTQVNGTNRKNIAEVGTTGELTPFDPFIGGVSDPGTPAEKDFAVVNGLSVTPPAILAPERRLYVVGQFTTVDGTTRNSAAAFVIGSGALAAWNPDMKFNAFIQTLNDVKAADDGVYVAGVFTVINNNTTARAGIARVDSTTGFNDAAFAPPAGCCGGNVNAIALNDLNVYMAGSLQTAPGVSVGAAALQRSNGALTAFAPPIKFTFGLDRLQSVAVSGNSVYLGGTFRNKTDAELAPDGDQNPPPRENLASYNATTGATFPWAPSATPGVVAIAADATDVVAGGDFTVFGGVKRTSLGAIDLTTGKATAFNPPIQRPGVISALAVAGGQVWAGGSFGTLDLLRSFLVGFDPVTGAVGPNDPGFNEQVRALLADGDTVYAGGTFTSAGGQERRSAAAFNAGTGAVLPFKPETDGVVSALARSGSTVYLGGAFTEVNGRVARRNVAAVESTNGDALSFNPGADAPAGTGTDDAVRALALGGSNVFVGGGFPGALLAFDATTGAKQPFAAALDGPVRALVGKGDTLYAAGEFTSPGAAIAGFDIATGTTRDAVATLDDEPSTEALNTDKGGKPVVFALDGTGDQLRLGGDFLQRPAGLHVSSTAFLGPIPTPTPAPTPTVEPTVTPSPTPDTTAPVLSKLKAKPKTFRAAKGKTKATGRASAKRKKGTTISFRLSEAATVRFKLVQKVKRKGKKKARSKTVGTFRRTARAGTSKVKFTGRLKKKALRGKLTLTAQPSDAAGNRGKTRSIKLRIVR